ncbi:GNAT family N-acetyltransferase [Arcticibacter sp.]|uniref:GNAT family N-acetyltransferase n=1 Tax=Arcticibacter sp. TaxID=1872630 RepID=UPI0038907239
MIRITIMSWRKWPSLRKCRGKKVGWLLANAVVEAAGKMGAKRLYLESNTSLMPAINLYRKLGFKEVTGRPTPYERADIQMSLDLK